MLKYYRNAETHEIRVAQQFDTDDGPITVVVKFFDNSNVRSTKIWRGELSEIEKYWKTLPWNCSGVLADSYAAQFWSAVHEDAFTLSEIDYDHQLEEEEAQVEYYANQTI